MSEYVFKTLNDEEYKNWIKAEIGLRTVQTVLCNRTDTPLKRQYEQILEGYERLLEVHAEKKPDKYQHIKNKVIENHLFKTKNWPNSKLKMHQKPDAERYNHVEFGKCFIRTPGYLEKMNISEIDFSGLIHILLCNSGLHCILEQPPERVTVGKKKDEIKQPHVFAQALKVRNDIHHSSKGLSTEKLNGYILDLIAVLDNLKPDELGCTKVQIERAKKRLKELKKIDFHVSTTEEIQSLDDAIAFVKSEIERLKIRETDMLNNIDDIQKKVDSHESRLNVHDQRLNALENIRKESEKLAMTRKDLNNQKQKKELQQHLIGLYNDCYVKTSLCPFDQRDNVINIADIYVEPNIEESQKVFGRDINLSDLLRKNRRGAKRVFVIGHVGSGKTSLCLFFLQSWCNSVAENRDESNTKSNEFKNIIREMRNYDFVFYLPLWAVSEEIDNYQEMIKTYYQEFNIDNIIDEVFEKDSHKCILLADGLDEWKLPQSIDSRPLHYMYGCPVLSRLSQSTVMVTSRPNATGILRMRKSDRDLEVNLLGVTSVEYMIQKYCENHYCKETTKTDILEKVKKLTEVHKLKTPMLLSCLVWMLTNGFDIEQTNVSATYSSIINIMFEWHSSKFESSTHVECDKIASIHLPEMLEKYKISHENRLAISNLSRIAFDMGNAPICQTDVESYCSGDKLTYLLKTGMLHHQQMFFPNKTFRFSFIHTSFLEYFVALHVVISQNETHEVQCEFFERCTNVANILRLSNVFVFICGLAPKLIDYIFEHIYKTLSRKSETFFEIQEQFQIQELVKKCLLEHSLSSKVEPQDILHYALVVTGEEDEFTNTARFIKNVDIEKIMTLSIENCIISKMSEELTKAYYFLIVEVMQKPAVLQHNMNINGIRANKLTSLSICKCVISHDDYLELTSLVEQAVALESLELKYIKCETKHNKSHERHIIDLKENTKIKNLLLIDKKNAFTCKIKNLKNSLKKCVILCTDLIEIDCLIQCQNLKHLNFGSCDESYGEYNIHMNEVLRSTNTLKTLHIRNMNCVDVSPVPRGSMNQLCDIRMYNLKMSSKSFGEFLDGIILCLQQRVGEVRVRVDARYISFFTEEELQNSLQMIAERSDKLVAEELNISNDNTCIDVKIITTTC
ncbi:uncharacterized protein LOC132760595 [Ruditapes philippinarum]|uniref:uncharacterized protein LOC132760595 n=1 Tax=Ruditapes philippinarum TaxID=129788 RepID=UPI00295B2B87|nr:uncharacterized protein LOC132760595 [Ruditapes philippinarum]